MFLLGCTSRGAYKTIISEIEFEELARQRRNVCIGDIVTLALFYFAVGIRNLGMFFTMV